MANLFQGGGGCNPNVMGSNQYKNMMGHLATGSHNPERMMQMGQKGQSFEEDILKR